MMKKSCLQVSTSGASYEFIIYFYEFRNPLGLQCRNCGSGGPPSCCDDVNQTENCSLRCDTRFRFLLRLFGTPVETAPNRPGFPYFSNGKYIPNSTNFTEGPNRFVISNSFTSPTQVNGHWVDNDVIIVPPTYSSDLILPIFSILHDFSVHVFISNLAQNSVKLLMNQ